MASCRMFRVHGAILVGIMTAARNAKLPAALRAGDSLRIGREVAAFGRNILLQNGSTFELQHRLFVNDPWELMAEALSERRFRPRPKTSRSLFGGRLKTTSEQRQPAANCASRFAVLRFPELVYRPMELQKVTLSWLALPIMVLPAYRSPRRFHSR